jgi:hypothetical protein
MHLQPMNRNHIGLVLAVLLAAGLSACTPQESSLEATDASQKTSASAAPPAPEAVVVTVPRGTELSVTLSTTVGSAISHVGDSLSATTTTPIVVGDRVAIPTGSTIHGQVTGVGPATKGLDISEKGGVIVLSFDKVTTPRGQSTALSASLADFAKSGKKTGGIIGGSAAGGALLGKLLGGKDKDALVGAILGSAIGTGIAAGTKGKELEIRAGTELFLTLDESLSISTGA